MSTPTVRMLADDPALGLRLLAGAAAADRDGRAARTPTDLDQPGALPAARASSCSPTGCGPSTSTARRGRPRSRRPAPWPSASGSPTTTPRCRPTCSRACEELGLPLLEVPEELSFSMIAAVAADGGDPSGLRLQLSRTRRLLQRLGAGGGHAALLDFLRQETRLAVWLVGPGGRRRTLRPRCPTPSVARQAARAARRGELPAAIGEGACAFGAAPFLAARTAVLVGAPLGDIGDDARLVIEQVTAYVVLEDAQARAQEEGRRVLAGELRRPRLERRPRRRRARCAPARARLPSRPAADRRRLGQRPARRHLRRPRLRRHERVRPPPRRGRPARRVRRRRPHRRARRPDRRRRRRAGARRRPPARRPAPIPPRCASRWPRRPPRSRSRARGRPASASCATSTSARTRCCSTSSTGRCCCRSASRCSARSSAGTATATPQLVRTLRAFLANDGQWRVTAAQLHIHHNTLRYRIGRVAALSRPRRRDHRRARRLRAGAGDPGVGRRIGTACREIGTRLRHNRDNRVLRWAPCG